MASDSIDAVSINPATDETFAQYPYQSPIAVEHSLAIAKRGAQELASWSTSRRAEAMLRMASLLRANRVELANLAAREMGKPVSQGRAEAEKCASLCAWCAEHGPGIIADENTQIGPQAYVSYLPIGIVLGVMPWNFPFWQAMRGAAGILFGGNGYVLKHAPNVMGCAYVLKGLWQEAGLPAGAFTVLNVRPEAIASVISDDRIAAVAVTGSVRAGASIASLSGASIKKTVLELGGSDPFIVLRDADIDRAVEAAVAARFQNTGQVCIAAKRIILDGSIAEEFTARFLMAVANLIVGDPMSEETFIGPMARTDLRDELHLQVEKSISEGANMLLGGRKLLGVGNYYTPTVLGDVRPGMTAFREETFGPVASLIIAQDADDAVRLANDSEFGLSASIWSRDSAGAKALARRIHTGGVFINGYGASDPRVPIGGVKRSGYGRELSHFGIKEFLNAQTVWLDRR